MVTFVIDKRQVPIYIEIPTLKKLMSEPNCDDLIVAYTLCCYIKQRRKKITSIELSKLTKWSLSKVQKMFKRLVELGEFSYEKERRTSL